MLAQGGHHSSRVLARHLHQHAETRMTLYQRGHVAVARPAKQITFPMTGNGTIFDFRRSFADGDGIGDPALGVPVDTGVPRAADPPLRSQMPNQLLFQRSARLNEQAAINRFVRHAQALVVRVVPLQPSGMLMITLVTASAAAYEHLLDPTAIRKAYFLGSSNRESAVFLSTYKKALPRPQTSPYIAEIEVRTPFAQVVVSSREHSVGYSPMQAEQDYKKNPDTIQLRIQILPFTVTSQAIPPPACYGVIRINSKEHNRLRDPAELSLLEGKLVFMEENQVVVFWGVDERACDQNDPEVFQASNEEPIVWYSEEISLSDFIIKVWRWQYGLDPGL